MAKLPPPSILLVWVPSILWRTPHARARRSHASVPLSAGGAVDGWRLRFEMRPRRIASRAGRP